MSSGSELLRRLRKQQRPSFANHETKKAQHEKNQGSGVERTAAVTVTTTTTKTNDVAIAERTTSSSSSSSSSRSGRTNTTINTNTNTNTNTKTTTIIEVCLGPDCSGSGGGAALLEIEELVSSCRRSKLLSKSKSKSNSQDNNSDSRMEMDVISGGCRDFCTMGPNVLVKKSTRSTGRNSIMIDAHYSKVDGPEACRDIVASALGEESIATTTTTTSSSSSSSSSSSATATTSTTVGDDATTAMASILKRREDGIRWRSHRKRAAKERRLRVRERPSTSDA